MGSTLQHQTRHVDSASASEDHKTLALLYDEHAAVVLGFLEKMADDKARAEELLQAVFLALPARLNEFDPHKGRFVPWLLNLARTIARQTRESVEFKTNGENAATNSPIRGEISNVHSPNAETATAVKPVTMNNSRAFTAGKEESVVELLYVKGYTFAQAAAELNIEEHAVRLLVRSELKKYRNPDTNRDE